jgi:hypothetical protein
VNGLEHVSVRGPHFHVKPPGQPEILTIRHIDSLGPRQRHYSDPPLNGQRSWRRVKATPLPSSSVPRVESYM